MPKVRCISRKVNGMTEVALPQLFLDPFADGEERDIPDDSVAEAILRSPCFEEVIQKPAAPKADAQFDGGKL